MSHKKGILFLMFFLFLMLPLLFEKGAASAQALEIEGQVIDADTEVPLIGVNITVQDELRGTTTNQDGLFSLTADAEDILIFSYLGYQTREVAVDGQTTLIIEMMSEAIYGEEMVVIGYGVRQVGDNTGSISTVSSYDFNVGAITSPSELFQGRIPGVEVVSADGAPGSGATVRIRGGSSLSASNEPLYVIDGVPIPAGDVSGTRDPLSTINPHDIESVTVLKDASATAIYGSRASNGVIMITTKRGRVGQPLSISYTGNYSYDTQMSTLDVLSTDQFRTAIEEQFGETGTAILGNTSTNWQSQIYSNVFSHDHNVSVSGSLNRLPYHASFGFTDDNGMLNTSENDRMTGSLRLSPTFLDNNLQVDLNLRGTRDNNRFANQGAIGAAVAFDPTQPVFMEDDRFGGYYAWLGTGGNPNANATDNPVALLEQTMDESIVLRSIGNLQLDYTLPFLQDLTTTLNLGYDYSDVHTGRFRVPDNAAFDYEGDAFSGNRTDYGQTRQYQLLDFYLNYGTDLNSISSRLDATAGYSWSHNYEEGSNFSTNYNIQDTLVVHSDTDYKTENYLVSFFGRVNYTFMDRYLFTATLRADGSSRFAEENRWGYFPSMAFAWSINEEPFMQDLDRLSNLTLRLGYGITGQQEILQGNYPYLARYTYSENTARYRFGDEFITTLRPEGYNSNLKWEETTTYNIALDYGFMNNRITGTLEAYHRVTDDLLNVVPVPAGTNFTNRIISNVGTLEVQGLEFDVTGSVILTSDTHWQVGFNANRNVNEITQLTVVDDPSYIGVETGEIAGGVGNLVQIHSVGYPRNAFFVYEQVYDENGMPVEGAYVDRNNDGIINDADKYRLGSPDPDFSFGFSSSLTHRNWDASFSARAQFGNYVYNNVNSEYGFYGDMFYNNYLRNSPAYVLETGFVDSQFDSDHYIEDVSFLRMDDVTLGYTFENVLDFNTNVRLSGTVNNVFVITNYSGLDPEVWGGIDDHIYPRPRTFVMSLQIDF